MHLISLIWRVSINLCNLILVALEEEYNSFNDTLESKGEHLSVKQRHQMRHRELFLSRQIETLPATHIRGKCAVTLLNEEESLMSYLNKDVSSKVDFHTFLHFYYTVSNFFSKKNFNGVQAEGVFLALAIILESFLVIFFHHIF